MKIKGSKELNESKGEISPGGEETEKKEEKDDARVNDNTNEFVEAIDECVNTFRDHFKNKSEDEVLNSLKATSMNIEKSYLYQCDTELFKSNYHLTDR